MTTIVPTSVSERKERRFGGSLTRTLTTDRMPVFSLQGYGSLLRSLQDAGYAFGYVGDMRRVESCRTAYLRHDIDLHLLGVDNVAEVEAELGLCATYYVAFTQPYNVHSPENVAILKRLLDLGHELGLHYDLTCYPDDLRQARERLAWDVATLERLSGGKVRSLCMHQPHTGDLDIFAACDTWVNPHDPRYQEGLVYISDSCRAWRDEALLDCLTPDGPSRLLLNTHPELWFDGSIVDRERYLDEVVIPNSVIQNARYLDETVRAIWHTHSGARAHDARIAGRGM